MGNLEVRRRPAGYQRTMSTALIVLALSLLAGEPARPPGTLIVLNKADSTASLIDLATGRVFATLPTGKGPHEVAVAPDGRTAVATNYGTREDPGGTLTVIDVSTARVLRTIDIGAGRRPHGIVFLDRHRALVTAEGAGALLVVDVAGGTVEAVIPTRQELSHMVAVTPDRSRGFVTNIGSGTVTAVDLRSRKVLGHVPTGRGAEGIAVTADGREVWVTNRGADTVSVIDSSALAVVSELACPSFPIRVAITGDGRRALVTNARSGDVAVIDVAERRTVGRLRAGTGESTVQGRLFDFAGAVPIGVAVDSAGDRAYVAHANADVVAVFDLASGKVAATLRAGREPDGMALSPLRAGGE